MQAAMQARIASGEAARGLSEPARERLQGALDFTQSAIPALEIAVRGLELQLQKRMFGGQLDGADQRAALTPPRLAKQAEEWATRQVELSFITGAGSDEVRRLLMAVQEAERLGSLREEAGEGDALTLSKLYLKAIEQLGRLHVREEWLQGKLDSLPAAAPAAPPSRNEASGQRQRKGKGNRRSWMARFL